MELLIDKVASPIGAIDIVAADGKLLGLEFANARDRMAADLGFRFGAVAGRRARNPFGLGDRIRAYFAGDLAAIDDIDVETGGTPFQRRVWAALRRVPAGATITYSDLAHAAGRPRAIRAAGAANGRNPISIVVPCHRVIGRDGTLTGYGGGLDRKRWLLVTRARGCRRSPGERRFAGLG